MPAVPLAGTQYGPVVGVEAADVELLVEGCWPGEAGCGQLSPRWWGASMQEGVRLAKKSAQMEILERRGYMAAEASFTEVRGMRVRVLKEGVGDERASHQQRPRLCCGRSGFGSFFARGLATAEVQNCRFQRQFSTIFMVCSVLGRPNSTSGSTF